MKEKLSSSRHTLSRRTTACRHENTPTVGIQRRRRTQLLLRVVDRQRVEFLPIAERERRYLRNPLRTQAVDVEGGKGAGDEETRVGGGEGDVENGGFLVTHGESGCGALVPALHFAVVGGCHERRASILVSGKRESYVPRDAGDYVFSIGRNGVRENGSRLRFHRATSVLRSGKNVPEMDSGISRSMGTTGKGTNPVARTEERGFQQHENTFFVCPSMVCTFDGGISFDTVSSSIRFSSTMNRTEIAHFEDPACAKRTGEGGSERTHLRNPLRFRPRNENPFLHVHRAYALPTQRMRGPSVRVI